MTRRADGNGWDVTIGGVTWERATSRVGDQTSGASEMIGFLHSDSRRQPVILTGSRSRYLGSLIATPAPFTELLNWARSYVRPDARKLAPTNNDQLTLASSDAYRTLSTVTYDSGNVSAGTFGQLIVPVGGVAHLITSDVYQSGPTFFRKVEARRIDPDTGLPDIFPTWTWIASGGEQVDPRTTTGVALSGMALRFVEAHQRILVAFPEDVSETGLDSTIITLDSETGLQQGFGASLGVPTKYGWADSLGPNATILAKCWRITGVDTDIVAWDWSPDTGAITERWRVDASTLVDFPARAADCHGLFVRTEVTDPEDEEEEPETFHYKQPYRLAVIPSYYAGDKTLRTVVSSISDDDTQTHSALVALHIETGAVVWTDDERRTLEVEVESGAQAAALEQANTLIEDLNGTQQHPWNHWVMNSVRPFGSTGLDQLFKFAGWALWVALNATFVNFDEVESSDHWDTGNGGSPDIGDGFRALNYLAAQMAGYAATSYQIRVLQTSESVIDGTSDVSYDNPGIGFPGLPNSSVENPFFQDLQRIQPAEGQGATYPDEDLYPPDAEVVPAIIGHAVSTDHKGRTFRAVTRERKLKTWTGQLYLMSQVDLSVRPRSVDDDTPAPNKTYDGSGLILSAPPPYPEDPDNPDVIVYSTTTAMEADTGQPHGTIAVVERPQTKYDPSNFTATPTTIASWPEYYPVCVFQCVRDDDGEGDFLHWSPLGTEMYERSGIAGGYGVGAFTTPEGRFSYDPWFDWGDAQPGKTISIEGGMLADIYPGGTPTELDYGPIGSVDKKYVCAGNLGPSLKQFVVAGPALDTSLSLYLRCSAAGGLVWEKDLSDAYTTAYGDERRRCGLVEDIIPTHSGGIFVVRHKSDPANPLTVAYDTDLLAEYRDADSGELLIPAVEISLGGGQCHYFWAYASEQEAGAPWLLFGWTGATYAMSAAGELYALGGVRSVGAGAGHLSVLFRGRWTFLDDLGNLRTVTA
ncbi:MAG: hypothetical protein AB7S38_29060 [Vulcanimicrobiota bacterium]